MTDGLMFPKPTKRKSVKATLRKEDAKWVKSVRLAVFERDVTCRACKDRMENIGKRYPWWRESDQFHLHMHEIIFRSKTAGRPMERRINTKNCIVLCSGCHRALHDARIAINIEGGSVDANGALVFEDRTSLW
jgi:5-methylcytosine-specific restriction endonuclease McrA